MKIRILKRILRQRGYTCRSGKGSHHIWVHPSRPEQRIVLAGADGKEAHPYQVAQAAKNIGLVARFHGAVFDKGGNNRAARSLFI